MLRKLKLVSYVISFLFYFKLCSVTLPPIANQTHRKRCTTGQTSNSQELQCGEDGDDEIIFLQALASVINCESRTSALLFEFIDVNSMNTEWNIINAPGKGNSKCGSKATYERQKGTAKHFYNSVRHSYDPEIWNNFTGCSEEDLDDLFDMTAEELTKPMDVRFNFSED